MSFSDLGLLPELRRAVADKGYDSPSPIQIQAIPAVLAYNQISNSLSRFAGRLDNFGSEFSAISEPIPFSGAVQSIKTSSDQQQALAVVASLSGRYEAYLLTAHCSA